MKNGKDVGMWWLEKALGLLFHMNQKTWYYSGFMTGDS